jgi:hypothetical protein
LINVQPESITMCCEVRHKGIQDLNIELADHGMNHTATDTTYGKECRAR